MKINKRMKPVTWCRTCSRTICCAAVCHFDPCSK